VRQQLSLMGNTNTKRSRYLELKKKQSDAAPGYIGRPRHFALPQLCLVIKHPCLSNEPSPPAKATTAKTIQGERRLSLKCCRRSVEQGFWTPVTFQKASTVMLWKLPARFSSWYSENQSNQIRFRASEFRHGRQ